MEKRIQAQPGQSFEDFVRELIMSKQAGSYQFNQFTFELNGREDIKDFYLLNASFWMEKARTA